MLSCVSRNGIKNLPINLLKITKVDTISNYYVFRAIKENTDSIIIVLANKNNVSNCNMHMDYIICDSVYTTSQIKVGQKVIFSGFYLGRIGDVEIKKTGELIHIVNSCKCFMSSKRE